MDFMDFMEYFVETQEKAERACERVINILDTAFPEDKDDALAEVMKYAVLATVIDTIALRYGTDAAELKRQMATLGEVISTMLGEG